MKNIIRTISILAALLLAPGAQARVTIVDNSITHYASGELRAAAVAGAESAYIYCDISGPILGCGAADGHGMFASCFTDDIRAKELFASMGKTSSISFFFNPQTGRCDSVSVDNSSLQFDTVSPAAPHFSAPPVADLVNKFAYGSMNSATTTGPDAITCTSGDSYVACAITDANGNTASCFLDADTQTQTLDDSRLAIAGFNDSSYVFFRWEGTRGGPCLDLFVSNGSWYLQ